jgi:hypothetical protein
VVRWVALLKSDDEIFPSWVSADWGWTERTTLHAESGPDGRFSFAEHPLLPHGSCLTVHHAEHRAHGLDLAEESSQWRGLEIVLEPAAPITVTVLDESERPGAGVTVRHASRARSHLLGAGTSRPRWERMLVQEVVTDASGSARLSPFPDEQSIWAEVDGLVSRPWHGRAAQRVTLRLCGSFTVGGAVTLPDWDPQYAGERRILVTGVRGNMRRPLATLRQVEEGDWGPLRVPLDGSTHYTIRLDGAPIIPIEETLPAPVVGAHRRFDLHAQKGEDLYLLVHDEQEVPIPTATATVTWGDMRTSGGSVHVEGASRSDGVLYAGSIPAGSVRFEVTAPGYGRAVGEGRLPSEEAYFVYLPRAGTVRGHCVRNGKPVPNFEVIFWNEGTARYHSSESFFDREDGRFELEDIGAGSWTFLAADPGHPGGRPVIVEVEAGAETDIELELPPAILGAGRVIDAESGEGVPDARVQLYSSGGLARSAPWGQPILTGQDGAFEVDAFVIGKNYVSVEADGYAWFEASATAGEGDLLDWGDLRLFRPQTLELRLLGIEELTRCGLAELRVGTYEGFLLPEKSFERDGTVLFQGVPPGDHRLLISYPDGSYARLQLQLEHGKEWTYDHRIAGARKLGIRAVKESGVPLDYDAGVMVAAREETGILVIRMAGSTKGTVSFDGIRAPSVEVFVYGHGFEVVASRKLSFDGRLELDVEIPLAQERMRVRVQDPEGEPLAGAWVTIRSSDGADILALDDTGSDGWAELVGLPESVLLMDVSHGIAGWCQGIAIDASVEEHEFVLEASSSLELRIQDVTEPLGGVITQVQTTSGVNLRDSKDTGSDGSVRYGPLGEGAYRLYCHRADCWPVTLDHQLSADEHAVRDVQMRRLADVVVTVVNRDGLPVSGLDLVLRSAEFGEPVATWIEAGKVESSTGITTDVRGQIRAKGLPRGEYVWSVPGEGSGLERAFELTPGVLNEVTLRLAQ